MIVPPTTEQLREMSAVPCPYWHNHTNPPATPASQEHTGAVSWLCRIGLHRWRIVTRHSSEGVVVWLFGVRCIAHWVRVGEKCRRCGKRRQP